MNTSPTPRSDPERLEQIVAYLDGELSAEEGARVEQQLAIDEPFRQQLQGMQRAWDALDQLPIATVKDDFSRTTMEMVATAAARDVSEKTLALPVQRRKRGLATALLAATAVLLGMLAFRIAWQNPNRLLLADLAVIDNIDIYTQFENVNFLDQLQQSLQGTPWPGGVDKEAIADDVERFQKASGASGRQQWLEQLSDGDHATLRAKFNRFRGLPPERQQQLRDLHAQVAGAVDRPEALIRYGRLLAEIPASYQFELRQLPIDQSVRRIKDELHKQAAANALELSAEELNKLMDGMRREVERMMSDRERRELNSLQGRSRMEYLARTVRSHMPRHAQEFLAVILAALPQEKRAELEKLPRDQRREQIQHWGRQAVAEFMARRNNGRLWRFAEISEQQLEQFFVELDPAQQERLLRLPRDKMLGQLQQMVRGRWRQDRWNRRPEDFRPRPGPPGLSPDGPLFRDHRGRPRPGDRRPPPPPEDAS